MDAETFLSALALGLLALLTVRFVELQQHPWLKAILAALLAGAGPLIAGAIDWASARMARPEVRLVPNFTPDQLQLRVEADEPTLDGIALDLHTPVWVSHVSRTHSVGAARDIAFIEGESALPFLTNRVEIRADDIGPDQRSLGYLIHYEEPPVPAIQFADRDFVRLEYTWKHKGERQKREQWFSLPDGTPVEKPWARIGPVRMVGDAAAGELRASVMPLQDGPPSEDQVIVFIPTDDVRRPLVREAPFSVVKRREVTP